MKKILVLLLVMVLALGCFAGCGEPAATQAPTATKAPAVEPTPEPLKLVMYTEGGFPPFEYYDEKGDLVGVDVDVAKYIAEALNAEIEIKDVAFSAITSSVAKESNALGLAGLTITEERLKEVDFTTSYFTSKQAIIYKKGALTPGADGLMPLDVMNGKKVGVQTGTSGDYLVQDVLGEGNEKGYKNALVASMDIGSGVDYVVIDNIVAKNIVAKNDKLACTDLAAEPELLAAAVQKGNTDLLKKVDDVIKQLIADGTMEELMVKHSQG